MDPLIFSEDYYRRLDDLQRRHWWCRGIRGIQASLLRRYLKEKKNVRVLDAGCGTGAAFSWMREQMEETECLVGFDISPHALRINRARPDGAPACQASVLQLPFRSANFDLVLCDDVLQHVYSGDLQALKEFNRVLRPDGWLLLRTNARHLLGANEDEAWDFHRYSLHELSAKATDAGFTVVRSTHVNALPSLIGELPHLFRRSKPHGQGAYEGLGLRDRPASVQGVLSAYMGAEAVLIGKLKLSLPFGHSILVLLRKPPDS